MTEQSQGAHIDVEQTVQEQHGGKVTGVEIHEFYGERVVTASSDGTARVWDASSNPSGNYSCSLLAVLNGHTNLVLSAAFSPDGERVVTASADNTARVWIVGLDNLLAEARRQLLPMLTLEECKQYFPDDCPPDATEVPLP